MKYVNYEDRGNVEVLVIEGEEEAEVPSREDLMLKTKDSGEGF